MQASVKPRGLPHHSKSVYCKKNIVNPHTSSMRRYIISSGYFSVTFSMSKIVKEIFPPSSIPKLLGLATTTSTKDKEGMDTKEYIL